MRAATATRLSASLPTELWPNVEQRLLLEAALFPGDRGIAAFLAWRSRIDPQDDFGWNVVRLLPLVYHNMHSAGLQDPLLARLKGVYRRAWCETHRLFHQTAPAVARLTAELGDITILKGAPLVGSYYRNHALRPMADLDLAVPTGDAWTAIRVLQACGFRTGRAVSDDLLRFSHAVQCFGSDGAQLDLHWHVLFEAPTESADRQFRAATEPAQFMGTSVRQPDPTSLLLQVIVHGVRSNEETPIRWIPDALTILRQRGGAVDWTMLLELARRYKLGSRLGLGLGYLRDWFDAPVPATAIAALSEKPSLLERVENTVMLADSTRFARSALGTQWVAFTEYCRYARGGAWSFLTGYTEYIRFRWELGGRREILPTIVRGMTRRLDRGSARGGRW